MIRINLNDRRHDMPEKRIMEFLRIIPAIVITKVKEEIKVINQDSAQSVFIDCDNGGDNWY